MGMTAICYTCGECCNDALIQTFPPEYYVPVCIECSKVLAPQIGPDVPIFDGQVYSLSGWSRIIDVRKAACAGKAKAFTKDGKTIYADDYTCRCGRLCCTKTDTKCWWCEAPIK